MADASSTAATSPTADPPPQARRWLWAQARRAPLPLMIAVIAGLLSGILGIAQAGLVAHIVHQAVIHGVSVPALTTAFTGLALVLGVRPVCGWVRDSAGTAAAQRIKQAARGALLARLGAAGPAFATRQHHGGAVAVTATDHVEALEGYYGRYLPHCFLAAMIPLAVLAAAAAVDWVVALILLISGPLIPLFMALVGMGAAALHRRQADVLARMSGHFLDRLQGLMTLKLMGRVPHTLDEVARTTDSYRRHSMQVLRVAFLSSAVLEFFAAVAIALVAVYVGFALLEVFSFGPAGAMTLFTGLFVLMLAPEFFAPLRALGQHYHDRAAALGAAAALEPMLRAEGRNDPRGIRGPRPTRGEPVGVRLADIEVRYPGRDHAAIQGLSLEVAPCERIAVAGPSGSGKSTLLALLLGFVQLRAGAMDVRVRGAGLTPRAVRHASAWMAQSVYIFHGTLRENIRLGRPQAGDRAVQAAADAATVSAFAGRLPSGLSTVVGERGFGLSGGQAQRVGAARAILRDGAGLVLLDEPTAHLDPDTAAQLTRALDEHTRGRTVILCTHDPMAWPWMDRVIHLPGTA